MTYAEKVWGECYEAACIEDMDGDDADAIAIISAALKKQRERCAAKAFETYKEAPEVWSWIRDAILNAEVEVRE